MTNFRPVLLAASLLPFGLSAAPAHAQLARTFVSSFGSDSNDCNRATPCRTFQRAHDNTLPLGEITVLDPGGYGAVTITQAISITNDGVGEAGVLVSGGATGITVNAAASDAVSLRGLTVKGIGFGGGNGIVFNSGAALNVENCAIRSMSGTTTGEGILFQPNGVSHLAVLNTIVADNGFDGIVIRPTGSGAVTADLRRVRLIDNQLDGLQVDNPSPGTISAIVRDSISAGNGQAGMSVLTGEAASLMVIRSMIAHNGNHGFGAFRVSGRNGVLRLGQS